MKILHSWLRDFITVKEPPNRIAEILSQKAFESSVKKVYGKDAIYEIALLPNRVADASSHYGIARELGVILHRKTKEPHRLSIVRAAEPPIRVDVRTPKLCLRYSAVVIEGITVRPSPTWLMRRLKACGLRPINNVVDITNYVMLELGQPLHAFDAAKVSGGIVVRKARKGETITTLDNKHYVLQPTDLVIADSKTALAIAGIKGGKSAEVSRTTHTVILESANFDPIAVSQTSRRLVLKTDSSWRFENGLDPNITVAAIERAALLIEEIAGGRVKGGIVDIYDTPVLARPIAFDVGWLRKFLGIEISLKEALALLGPIVEGVKVSGNNVWVRVATWRRDISEKEDLAEEIARLKGYDSIPSCAPVGLIVPPQRNEHIVFLGKLRRILAGLGVSELYLSSFIGERDAALGAFAAENLVEVMNPISAAGRYLRPTLLINLLKSTGNNLRFFDAFRVFEIGTVFLREDHDRIRESEYVAGIVAIKRPGKSHDALFEAKGIVEGVLQAFGLDPEDYHFDPARSPNLADGETMAVMVGDTAIGSIGMVDIALRTGYDIDVPVAYWELVSMPLMAASQEEHEFEPLHKYPDVVRDISIFVPIGTRVEDVHEVIFRAGTSYLEDVDLFDIYEGEGVPEDRISMAFHCVFRSDKRTLTDRDVQTDMKKILDALRAFGAEIR